jgi:hypothetical protein
MVSRVALPVLVVGALVAPAAAQAPGAEPAPTPPVVTTTPVPPPAASCRINLVRVPADMRAEIEGWVAAEPRCRVTLDVRVVATPEGLYVMATDPSGRILERTVPDATTAGVLIASWAADDGAPAAPTPAPAPEVATTPEPVAAATPAPAALTPPGGPGALTTPAPWTPSDGGPAPVAVDDDRITALRATVGLTTLIGERSSFETVGLRAHVDLWRFARRFKLGASGAVRRTSEPSSEVSSLDDVVLGGYIAMDLAPGQRLAVRGTAGFAATITTGDYMVETKGNVVVGPTAELTLTAGYAITQRLELQAGAVVSLMEQDIATQQGTVLYRRDILGELYIGVGFRR